MSTLQVANLHLESTGNNRIQLATTGTVAIVAAGSNTFVANSTDVNISVGGTNVISANSTAATITGGIVANGSVGTAGQVLVSGGAGANLYWGAGGGNYALQAYTSNTTWTKPANLKSIKVTVVGGGGGRSPASAQPGGGTPDFTGPGAGGGGYAVKYINEIDITAPVTVTIGDGGNTTVTTGGTSSFGAFVSATGGAIGSGGAGTSGNINIPGYPNLGTIGGGGLTAAYRFYPGGGGAQAGLSYGGGASGVYRPGVPAGAVAGANGASGIVIVEEFY